MYKTIIRLLIYATLTVGIFWTAHMHSRPLKMAEKERNTQVIKREIQLVWELIKVEVDLLNEQAQSYIEMNNLKPGSALPPKVFFKESDSTRQQLDTNSEVEIIKTFSASSGEYSTKATVLIAITNRVPKESEKYAYAGIEHNYEAFGRNFSVYPEDKFAIERLKKALRKLKNKKTYAQ